jgi:carbamoyltransferase
LKNIIGISCFYHDSAAAYIRDGEIICAVQEERFSRIKHDNSFPENSINYILTSNKLELNDIDYFIFYEKPFLKFDRILETFFSTAPLGFKSFLKSFPLWTKEKIFQKEIIFNCLKNISNNISKEKIYFSEHHLSHAASAFYPSKFEKSLILTLDAVGEWTTTSLAIGLENKIEIKEQINFPHSLGLLYSSFTYYLGFKVNSGEYKMMGLAPYGKPKFKEKILSNLIKVKKDGSFRLNMRYFNFIVGTTMINEEFEKLFGEKRRQPEKDKLTQFHMDVASSIQLVIEEIIIKISFHFREKYKIENLCLAGGVCLNCVVNGKLLEANIFKNIWIQPAAGDAGGALGAALAFWYMHLENPRKYSDNLDEMKGSFLGPHYNDLEIENDLKKINANYIKVSEDDMINTVAQEIADGKSIGWFQGKMEFGPRALGSRSILADPRQKDMQKKLNLKIKFRESFRPFAPSVLYEDLSKYFNLNVQSPYMQIVSTVKEELRKYDKNNKELFGIEKLNQIRSTIPAITHVDYSSRIQTVHKETNEIYYKLIKRFKEITGCSVLLNTSFNVRGEPIVNTPEDAFKCFMGTNLDILVIQNFILKKINQNKSKITTYYKSFNLD